ncbi:MAG TPA: hypothetical protein VHC70_03345 [Phycisphaerales bacterium]|nr:hypothetical protein [Phycisphaerales bacterium]
MHEINRVLSAAAMRLAVTNFIKGVIAVASGIVLGLIVARIVERVVGLTFDWKTIAYACGGAALVGGVVWAIVARPSKAAVARRVDEGANLKESLSTALSVERYQNEDPWARVTVESAVQKARGVRVAQAVPIAAPRFWPVPFALAIAFGIIYWTFPRLDVLGWRAQQVAQEKLQFQIKQAKSDAVDVKKFQEETMEKLGLEKDPDQPAANDRPEPRDPEAIRKQSLKDLTTLSERLDQLRNGEKGQKLDAVQNQLKQLNTPGQETSELAKAMAAGNFKAAEKALEKMKDQLSSSSMNETEKKALAEQLNDLSKQLAELGKNKQSLENALKNAGIDPKKASDPAELKKALDAAKNLTAEQKKSLQEQSQCQSQCKSAMDSLSKACSGMSQAAQSGDKQGAEQAAGQMQKQLSQLEQLKQEMDLADAAKSQCQGKMAGMCQNPGDGDKEGECAGMKSGDSQCKGGNKCSGGRQEWSANWSNSMGNRGNGPRTGGGGRAQGGQGDSAHSDFETTKQKDMGIKGQGPTVSSRLVEGDSVRGESHAEFVATVTKAEQGASDAMENNTIPREFHDAIKSYFGNLKKGDKNAAKDAGSEKPAAPAKPAQDAKDAGK